MAGRLPAWAWVGAAALSCVAGIVNVVGFLGYQHQAITHLTGNSSLLAAAVVAGDGLAAGHLLGSIAAFVAGAVLGGLLIQDSVLRLGRRYGVALALEAALLALAVPLFQHQAAAGAWCAAVACGLQNAMATTYSGAVIRTSHVSGMFTDLGISLGHALRGMPVDQRRLGVCVVVIVFFFAGGIVGARLFAALHYAALYVPAMLTGTVGLGYATYRQHRRMAGDLSA